MADGLRTREMESGFFFWSACDEDQPSSAVIERFARRSKWPMPAIVQPMPLVCWLIDAKLKAAAASKTAMSFRSKKKRMNDPMEIKPMKPYAWHTMPDDMRETLILAVEAADLVSPMQVCDMVLAAAAIGGLAAGLAELERAKDNDVLERRRAGVE